MTPESPSWLANPNRVFKTRRDNRDVWVKRSCKVRHNRLQRLLATLFPPREGSFLLREEMARAQAVRDLGMVAPEVLESGVDYIVLSDIGPSLQNLIRDRPQAECIALLQRGIAALRELHRRGGWHGNAALRNLTLDPISDRIGFIDFEGSVRAYLPLFAKQSYDLWQFCHAASRFDTSGTLTSAAFNAYPRKRNKILALVVSVLLAPAAFVLAPFARKMGRDIPQTIVTVTALLRLPTPRPVR